MSKKRLVVGNWKRYIEDTEKAKDLTKKLRRKESAFGSVEVWVAPAAPFISAVAAALKGSRMKVGAQRASGASGGAHTGDVSAVMLRSAGAAFSIVGHSEQRAAGESDAQVHDELMRVAEAGLRAVLCIGEIERDVESGSHFGVIANQLSSALAGFPKSAISKLVVAYEPVWAIGKSASDAMKPSDVRETAIFIRKTLAEVIGREAALKISLLYGGSVEPDNAGALIAEGDVNGFLVGHASVDAEAFGQIIQACK